MKKLYVFLQGLLVRGTAGFSTLQRVYRFGFALLLLSGLFSVEGFGQISVTTNKNWSQLSIQSNSNIVITNGAVLTIDVPVATANSISIGTKNNEGGTIAFSNASGQSMVLTQDIAIAATTAKLGEDAKILLQGNSISCRAIAESGQIITYSTAQGTLIFTGTFTLPTSLTSIKNVQLESTANVTVGHVIAIGDNLTSKSGSQFASTKNISIGGNLIEEASSGGNTSSITFSEAVSITGNLTVGAGATFSLITKGRMTVSGSTTLSGSLSVNASGESQTFTGPVLMSAGSSWNVTSVSAVAFNQGLINNGSFTSSTGNYTIGADFENGGTFSATVGTYAFAGNFTNTGSFSASSGVHTFSGSSMTINSSTALSFTALTVTGSLTNNTTLSIGTGIINGSLSNNTSKTLTFSSGLSGTGTLTNDENAILNIGGTATVSTLNASASGNTVNYTGTSQTVNGTNYVNLNLSGSGIKSLLVGTVSITSNLVISTGVQVKPNPGGSHAVANLTLGAFGKNAGTWGSKANATNVNTTFFSTGNNDNGLLNVSNDNRSLLTVQATNKSKTYGSLAITAASVNTDFTVTGLIAPDAVTSATLDYSGVPQGNTAAAAVGTYSITVSSLVFAVTESAENYRVVNGSAGVLTVSAKALTITANNASRVYGTVLSAAAGSTAFTSSGLVAGETITSVSLSYPTAVGGGNTLNDAVGTYTSTVTPSTPVGANGFVASNYAITYVSGSLAVTAKAITVSSSSFSITTKTYDGTTAATISGTPAYAGLVAPDDIAVTGTLVATFDNANAGSGKTVTVSGFTNPNANYTVASSMTTTGTISAAPLNIIANDMYKQTGTLLATSVSGITDFNASGIVGEEVIQSVTINYGSGRLTSDPSGKYTGSVVPSLPVGTSGFLASNYAITYSAADLYVEGMLYAIRNGDWHSTSSWSLTSGGSSCNCIPGANDVAYIERGFTITVTQHATAYSVFLAGSTNPQTGFLAVNAPATLNITQELGLLTFKSSGNTTGTISGTGTINTATLDLGSSSIRSVGQSINTLNINIANLNISGDISLYSNYQGSNKGAIAVLNIGSNSTVTANNLQLISTVNSISSTENLLRLSMGSGSTLGLTGGPNPFLINTNNTLIPQNVTISLDPTSVVSYQGATTAQLVPTSLSNSGTGGTTTPIPLTYGIVSVGNTSTGGASLTASLTTQNLAGDLIIENGLLKNSGFNIVGNSGKIFRVKAGATFEMSGTSSFPTGYSQYIFDKNSTTKYLQTNAQSISVQTYGHLHLMPAANGVTYTFGAGNTKMQNDLVVGNGTNTGTTVTAAANATVLDVDGDLTVASNASLLANAANTMYVGGNWTNNGTFTHNNGTVLLDGIDANLGGGSGNIFHNLVINAKTAGTSTKTLTSNATVKNLLTFTEGYFATNESGKLIIDNGAGVTGQNDKSYVVGPIKKIGTNGAVGPNGYTFTFPTGQPTEKLYDPVIIRFPLASADIAFTVTHYHGAVIPDSDKKDNNVKRLNKFFEEYWDIHNDHPGTGNILGQQGVDVTVHIHEKVKPNVPPNLYMIHRRPSDLTWEVPNMLSQTWSVASYLGNGQDAIAIFLPGQKDFSTYSTAGGLSSLPVTLTDFKARITPENKVALTWGTASESLNKGFRIQRQSANNGMGGKFEQLGFLPTKANGGNSQSSLYYNFVDTKPINGTSFYRLIQEDIDGTLTNSEVRLINMTGCESVVMMFPNPSKGSFTISRTPNGKKMSVQVYDLAGRIVKQVFNIAEPVYSMSLDQPGIYNVKLSCPETGEQSIQRILIQK